MTNDNLRMAAQALEHGRAGIKEAKMRQRYHFMAPAGWINDPNGVVYYKNRYHVFYQSNPFDAFWGTMYWGHAVSDDLFCWENLPLALAPGEWYDNGEGGGCFSGSAIEHEGKLFLIYTGVYRDKDKNIQCQCVAYSEDGVTFEKYAGNPVVTAPKGYDSSNFRDPKVWRHNDSFYFVCAACRGDTAELLLYSSKDLLNWDLVNVLFCAGKRYGDMWECPDLFRLADKDVLLFSPMGMGETTSLYLTGKLNYQTGVFVPEVQGRIDCGMDFYAPQTLLDGENRRIMLAWANAWQWMPWWKDWGPTHKEGWCGSFNLPREIVKNSDNTLSFLPAPQSKTLRSKGRHYESFTVTDTTELDVGDGVAYELQVQIDKTQSRATGFTLHLRMNGHEETLVVLDFANALVRVDRSRSDGWSTGVSQSRLLGAGDSTVTVQVFVDQASVEVFTDMGRTVHSNNVFADNTHCKAAISAQSGPLAVSRLDIWPLKATML